jgi:hypothetical protein
MRWLGAMWKRKVLGGFREEERQGKQKCSIVPTK